MFYTHSCSYCTKVFYTFNSNKEHASRALYHGIKQHLMDYDEDHKEHQFDDGPEIDSDEVYAAMVESSHAPSGGYEIK